MDGKRDSFPQMHLLFPQHVHPTLKGKPKDLVSESIHWRASRNQ